MPFQPSSRRALEEERERSESELFLQENHLRRLELVETTEETEMEEINATRARIEEIRERLAEIGQHPDYMRIGEKNMDWNTIITLAVSAVSPYAVAFATGAATAAGKELVNTTSAGIRSLCGRIWEWISQTVRESDDESAERAWEDFKSDPQANRQVLADVILRLNPNGDPVLRGYVQGVIQEVGEREGARLFKVLDTSFTLDEVSRVATRIAPRWHDELGGDPNKTKIANWVVDYTQKRHRTLDLIAAMLEVNPDVALL